MIHYFIWNGEDSRQAHCRVPNRVPVIRPEERVEHVTIPGRSGELTQVEGEDIYNSYIQTVTVTVEGAENLPAVEAWLRGDGFVTFDIQPELMQRARIINAVTFEKVSRNLPLWSGDVQFYCEPVKRLREESSITVTSAGTTVTNPGQLTARPRITLTGSGLVTLRMGGKALTIPDLVSGWTADSETEWILNGSAPVVGACRGDFPLLAPGENTVQWTGDITQLVIEPRWRFL